MRQSARQRTREPQQSTVPSPWVAQAKLPPSYRPRNNNCAEECVLDWERLLEARAQG